MASASTHRYHSTLMVLISTYGFIHYVICVSSGSWGGCYGSSLKGFWQLVPCLLNKSGMQINGLVWAGSHQPLDCPLLSQLPTCCCPSKARWSWQTLGWQASSPTPRSNATPLWARPSGWPLRSSNSRPTTLRWGQSYCVTSYSHSTLHYVSSHSF